LWGLRDNWIARLVWIIGWSVLFDMNKWILPEMYGDFDPGEKIFSSMLSLVKCCIGLNKAIQFQTHF